MALVVLVCYNFIRNKQSIIQQVHVVELQNQTMLHGKVATLHTFSNSYTADKTGVYT